MIHNKFKTLLILFLVFFLLVNSCSKSKNKSELPVAEETQKNNTEVNKTTEKNDSNNSDSKNKTDKYANILLHSFYSDCIIPYVLEPATIESMTEQQLFDQSSLEEINDSGMITGRVSKLINTEIYDKENSCNKKVDDIFIYDFKYTVPQPMEKAYLSSIECEKEFPQIIDPSIIEKEIHGEITASEEDINKEQVNLIFEAEVNKELDNKDKQSYKVVDYIKGNFTNSGHEEYLVFFATKEYIELSIACDNYIKEINDEDVHCEIIPDTIVISLIKCFIVSEEKIIRQYDIPVDCGLYPSISKSNIYKQGFGRIFFQGWVNDFNRNGINEIYLVPYDFPYNRDLCMLEFKNDKFYICNTNINNMNSVDRGVHSGLTFKVDWNKKILSYIVKDWMSDNFFKVFVQWNEKHQRFIFKKAYTNDDVRQEAEDIKTQAY